MVNRFGLTAHRLLNNNKLKICNNFAKISDFPLNLILIVASDLKVSGDSDLWAITSEHGFCRQFVRGKRHSLNLYTRPITAASEALVRFFVSRADIPFGRKKNETNGPTKWKEIYSLL